MGELKVLVLGDGLLGSEIIKQSGWDVISRKLGTFDINEIKKIPNNYDVILNCVANTDTYSHSKKALWDTNYKFVDSLIDYCNSYGMKLVHISTDYIYAESNNNASEVNTVPVHANNWYSYTKLLSDGLVQLRSEDYLVCRCSHKPNPFPYEKAWNDQFSNTDYVDVIAGLIIKAVNKELSGVYNIGTEKKTIYSLVMNDKDVEAIKSPNYVPKDITMNISKFNKAIKTPFFSIAIPAYGYNGKGVDFLKHNLNIIYLQTYGDFEVVLSDHSTDNTIKDVYDEYLEKGMNIKYVRNEVGRGIISPNLNSAMRNCTGEWIKILFQDDYLLDKYSLEIQFDDIKANPDSNWFMTAFWHSNDGESLYRRYEPKWNNLIWTGNNTMGCPSGMTLKNDDLIFFDEGLNWLVDVDHYKKMFDKYGEPKIIMAPTYVNRTHGTGLSSTTPMEVKNKEHQIINSRYGQIR